MAGHRGAPKLIPGLPLGGIDTIWSSELGLHGEFHFASAPQAERLVDDGAAIQLGVSGDIGIDAGQEVWIEGGGDLGTATGRSRRALSGV